MATMTAINAYRIAGQAPAHYPVATAVVPVLSNKCAWFGIKAQAKQSVAISDKTLPRRFKKLSRLKSSRTIFLR
jgi:hypothetical protein